MKSSKWAGDNGDPNFQIFGLVIKHFNFII